MTTITTPIAIDGDALLAFAADAWFTATRLGAAVDLYSEEFGDRAPAELVDALAYQPDPSTRPERIAELLVDRPELLALEFQSPS